MTTYYPGGFICETICYSLRNKLATNLAVSYAPLGSPSIITKVRNDGRPTIIDAGFQDYFISPCVVEQMAGDTNNTNDGLHEIINFEVVITRKLSHVSISKLADKTITLDDILTDPYQEVSTIQSIARYIQIYLHNNSDVLSEINYILSTNTSPTGPYDTATYQPFFVAPKWRSTSRVEFKGPEWILGLKAQENREALYGVIRVQFGGLERIQCTTTQDIQ